MPCFAFRKHTKCDLRKMSTPKTNMIAFYCSAGWELRFAPGGWKYFCHQVLIVMMNVSIMREYQAQEQHWSLQPNLAPLSGRHKDECWTKPTTSDGSFKQKKKKNNKITLVTSGCYSAAVWRLKVEFCVVRWKEYYFGDFFFQTLSGLNCKCLLC